MSQSIKIFSQSLYVNQQKIKDAFSREASHEFILPKAWKSLYRSLMAAFTQYQLTQCIPSL